MVYDLGYHPKVRSDDLKTLSAEARRRLASAIEKRLTTALERLGVRLSGPLRDCWKLRVGDHRVVYTIRGRTVVILAILHRKDVYQRAERRL